MSVHVVWGRSERLMPAKHLAFFKENLPPHATIEEPEGYGHCPHIDDPESLSRKIVDFARRVVDAA
jgi:pimeloyl-ACP methyl ester carboxylesterase